MPVTSRILDVDSVTPSDVDRWRELADNAAEPNIFFDPDFLVVSQKHFASLGRIKLLVVEDGPRWVALLAFEMVPGDRWWPVRHASTAGPILYEYTSLGTPLVARDDPDARVEALVRSLHEHRARLGFAIVVHLLSTGPVGARLGRSLAASGYVHQWRDDERAGAALARDESASPSRSSAFNRRIGRLAKVHGVAREEIVLVEAEPDPDAYLSFEMTSWKGTSDNGPAFGRGASTSAWFREVFTTLAARGKARRFVLQAGNATAYMSTCLISGPTAFGWYDAYAPADASASPGAIGRRLINERLSADPALNLFDSCMDSARYPDQTAQFPDRVRTISLTASLGPQFADLSLHARASAGPWFRESLGLAHRAQNVATTRLVTAGKGLRNAARVRTRAIKTSVTDRLRWRLGLYDEHILPPVPTRGITLTNVRLRRYTVNDCAARLALEASQGMDLWDENFTAAQTRIEYITWLSKLDQRMTRGRGPYSFAVEERSTGNYLGDVTLWRLRDQRATAEFGVALLPTARGRGIGREVTRGMVDWVFESGSFRRITFHHVVENIASCSLALGAGVPIEGRIHRAFETQEPGLGSSWHDLCQHGTDIETYRAAPIDADSAPE